MSNILKLAGAVAALSAAAAIATAPLQAAAPTKEKCFGISLKGEE